MIDTAPRCRHSLARYLCKCCTYSSFSLTTVHRRALSLPTILPATVRAHIFYATQITTSQTESSRVVCHGVPLYRQGGHVFIRACLFVC